MWRMVVLVVVLVACKKKAEDAPLPAPTPAPAPAPAQAVDAAQPAEAPVDEAKQAPTILDTEAIGPLKFGQGGDSVEKALGKPETKTKPAEEAATGAIVSTWKWKGAEVEMSGDTKTGPWKISFIKITSGTLATSKGIHIGSTTAEVKKAYPEPAKEESTGPDMYLVGSVYGGLLFHFKADKVDDIRLGQLAE